MNKLILRIFESYFIGDTYFILYLYLCYKYRVEIYVSTWAP